MNTRWMRVQDRRRSLIAGASTACLYALAFVGAWLIGSLAPASLASVPGPVIVDLGGNNLRGLVPGAGTTPPGTQPPGTQPPGTQPPGALPPGALPYGTQPPAPPPAAPFSAQ